MKIRLTAVLLVLVLAISAGLPALAYKYGNNINVEAVKAIEKADTFPVKIIQKKVVEGTFDGGLPDALVFTVMADSACDVRAVTVVYVPYDDECKNVKMRDLWMYDSSISSINDGMEILNVSKECTPDSAAKGIDLSVAVNWQCFSGVRAIVKCYTDADGNLVENPSYDRWLICLTTGGSAEGEELD